MTSIHNKPLQLNPDVQLNGEALPPMNGVGGASTLRWISIYGVWTLLGFIYTSQMFLGLVMEGMNHSYWRILAWQMLGCWWPWAVVTSPIFWLGRRFPIEKKQWARALSIHLSACVVIALIHSAWFTILTIEMVPFDSMSKPTTFSQLFWGRLSSQLHLELIVYAMILGVGYAFDYYSKYKEREVRTSQLEAQLAQAQLQALKMQLHPHFLFNTLNGIAGLVRDNENKVAVNMIAGLSSLLRSALENAGRQEVPLREELEFLEHYMELQRMRFPDRLEFQIEISPDSLDACVPNLILQPLVENAIRHGIATRSNGGRVGVQARVRDANLEISVFDDGPGLRNGWSESGGEVEGTGIGLSNTRARLRKLYGERFSFNIRNREGGGVEASIALPLHTI